MKTEKEILLKILKKEERKTIHSEKQRKAIDKKIRKIKGKIDQLEHCESFLKSSDYLNFMESIKELAYSQHEEDRIKSKINFLEKELRNAKNELNIFQNKKRK